MNGKASSVVGIAWTRTGDREETFQGIASLLGSWSRGGVRGETRGVDHIPATGPGRPEYLQGKASGLGEWAAIEGLKQACDVVMPASGKAPPGYRCGMGRAVRRCPWEHGIHALRGRI